MDITQMCPAFYVSERGEVHTTGVYITPSDDRHIHEQLVPMIREIENEESIMIAKQVDSFTVHVHGRFTPIGRIYVLAMLDPDWRP